MTIMRRPQWKSQYLRVDTGTIPRPLFIILNYLAIFRADSRDFTGMAGNRVKACNCLLFRDFIRSMTVFIPQAFYTQAGYKSPANISGSPGSGGITLKVDKVIIAGAAIIVILAIILVIAGACGACAFLASTPGTHGSFGQTEHEIRSDTHAGADNIDLTVNTFGGDVIIQEWADNSVKVTYDVFAPSGHLDEILTSTRDTKDGNSTTIIAEAKIRDQNLINLGDRGASVTVVVPKNSSYTLKLNTAGGKVTVPPLHGSSVYLNTLGGDISLNGGRYDTVDINTAGSRIYASYEATNATFNTLGGDIEIDTTQTAGTIEANTAGGDIDVRLPSSALFSVDATTMGGRVRHGTIHMTASKESDWQLIGQTEAGAGNLSIRLHTLGGNIDINY